MIPFLKERWGNPSSSYEFGAKLKPFISDARDSVARLLNAKRSSQIIFTSCGSESNNTAIHSACLSRREKNKIIISAVEHSSVLEFSKHLEKYFGFETIILGVDKEGGISLQELEASISDETAIVSIMWANNETGVIFPVEKIANICQHHKVPLHCDAVQAAGKVPIDVSSLGISYLSISSHKIGGPKGIGALYVAKGAPYAPLVVGGHQESGRRGGTENLPSIVGFGNASTVALKELDTYAGEVGRIRDTFESMIRSSVPDIEINGQQQSRIVNTSNLWFKGVDSEALLLLLDREGICASAGSACLADSPDPSHVIAAMKSGNSAKESVRFSFGLSNTIEDSQMVAETVSRVVEKLRN